MRIEIGLPRSAQGAQDSIADAFAAEGLHVDGWGGQARKAEVDVFTTVMVALALAPIGGIAWDLEKAALRHAVSALKRVIGGQRVGVIAIIERPDHEPVDYFIPSGPEGDLALDALDADYATDPPAGERDWWPGVGWMEGREMMHRMEAGETVLRASDTSRQDTDEAWIEFWTDAGKRRLAEFATLEAQAAEQLGPPVSLKKPHSKRTRKKG